MRPTVLLTALLSLCPALTAQDAREILRKSVELDQTNWQRLQDYTWNARSTERHFDSAGKVKSTEGEAWETIILDGEPFRRILERNGKPLSASDQARQQEKLDKETAKLSRETPEQKQHRVARYEAERRKEREFLREIPDAYNVRLDGEDRVDGHDVWVISGTPKPDYHPRTGDAKAFLKISGKIWIDKANSQWVRLEARTTDTISFGLVLARLYPGATVVFEQTPAAADFWVPKRLYMKGAGRLGIVKKIDMDAEVTWSNYRKFQVNSTVAPLPSSPP